MWAIYIQTCALPQCTKPQSGREASEKDFCPSNGELHNKGTMSTKLVRKRANDGYPNLSKSCGRCHGACGNFGTTMFTRMPKQDEIYTPKGFSRRLTQSNYGQNSVCFWPRRNDDSSTRHQQPIVDLKRKSERGQLDWICRAEQFECTICLSKRLRQSTGQYFDLHARTLTRDVQQSIRRYTTSTTTEQEGEQIITQVSNSMNSSDNDSNKDREAKRRRIDN